MLQMSLKILVMKRPGYLKPAAHNLVNAPKLNYVEGDNLILPSSVTQFPPPPCKPSYWTI